MESPLHLAMKKAVTRALPEDTYYHYESRVGYTRLRVDVDYTLNHTRYLVECETQPRTSRLIKKGEKRNTIPYRNIYILVVTEEDYPTLEYNRLKNYYDLVIAYDPGQEKLTHRRDLRTLGPYRDRFYDLLLPVTNHPTLLRFKTLLRHKYYHTKHLARTVIQCSMCKLGLDTPWTFCPRWDCPDSGSYSEKWSI